MNGPVMFDTLDDAACDAGGALDRAAQPNLFDRLDWFRLLRDHDADLGMPLVIRSGEGAARAWLFLAREGGGARAFANCYTHKTGVVRANCATPQASVDALVTGLRESSISQLTLAPTAADDPLFDALRRQGWLARRGPISRQWRITTSGLSFDRYWAARPSRLRNTVRRRAKAAGLKLVVLDRFDDAAWDDYRAVYAQSWKPGEDREEVLDALVRQEGEAGTLRLGLAYQGARAVAGQIWLTEGGHASIHKLAHDEDARDLSPGAILSAEMFRHALDVDRVEAIDFGIGDDGYKAEWMDESVPLMSVTAFDVRRPGGIAAAGRAAASKLVARVHRR